MKFNKRGALLLILAGIALLGSVFLFTELNNKTISTLNSKRQLAAVAPTGVTRNVTNTAGNPSCQYVDVNAFVNGDSARGIAPAQDGDTVRIPAGNCTWSDRLAVTKAISIIGSGASTTVITNNSNWGVHNRGNLIHFYKTDLGKTYAESIPTRLSGMTIKSDWYAYPVIFMTGPIYKIRIDHMVFDKADTGIISNFYGGATQFQPEGPVYGVVDSNDFINMAGHGAYYAHDVRKSDGLLGLEAGQTAWNEWQANPGAGTERMLYFEDNNFTYTPELHTLNTTNGTTGLADATFYGGPGGGKAAIRYNTFSGFANNYLDAHSNGSGLVTHTFYEIYGNRITYGTNTTGLGGTNGDVGNQRGGSMLFHNNILSSYSSPYYEMTVYTPWGPQEQEPTNTYFWSNSPSIRAPVSDEAPASWYNGYGNASLGTAYPNYSASRILPNQDFFLETTSFNGTAGIGKGTLANRPSTCTTGVGYWATNQSTTVLPSMAGPNPSTAISGTLYKCIAPNTWSSAANSYTPYPYPHPVRAESEGTPVNPPTIDVACSGDITSALQGIVNPVNNGTNVGRTVTVGAGNCTLSSPITLTRGITLKGAGRDSTFITSSGIAIDILPNSTAITNEEKIQVEGFDFNGNNLALNIIHIAGSGASATKPFKNLAVLNNRLRNASSQTSGSGAILTNGHVRGVISGNDFDRVNVLMKNVGSNNTNEWLNSAYRPFAYGNSDNLFFENNNIRWSSPKVGDGSNGWIESGQGGRVVVRYNTYDFTNSDVYNGSDIWDIHGFQNWPGNGQTGTMLVEYYGNTISNSNSGRFANHRGSWGLFYNNIADGTGPMNMSATQYHPDGTTAIVPGAPGNYIAEINNSYFFNNTMNGTEKPAFYFNGRQDSSTQVIFPNVNWWNLNSSLDSNPNSSAQGIGRGTSAPSGSCVNGNGYWVSSTPTPTVNSSVIQNSSFYKCINNTWTLYYRPYTYPHPLVSGTVVTPVDPVSRFLALSKSGGSQGTITSSPSGINCGTGAGCGANFDEGTVVTLNTTLPNNTDVSWSSNCTPIDADSCRVTMEFGRNTVVTASYNTVSDAPIAHFTLDAVDSTFSGATVNTTDKKVGAASASFDGVNDVVTIPTVIPSTGNMSFAAWIKRNATNDYGGIISKADGLNNEDFAFYVYGDNTLSFYISGGVVDSHGPTLPSDNSWHHVAATINGTTLTYYVDGSTAGTTSLSGTRQNRSFPTYIGRDYYDNSGIYYFNGLIDDVKIYNRAITAGEVDALFDAGTVTPTTARLAVIKNIAVGGTVTTPLNSINCGTTCSADLSTNQPITLTAAPATNYIFKDWTNCPQANGNQCTITLTGNATTTANFQAQAPVNYTLTINPHADGTGTVTGTLNGQTVINCIKGTPSSDCTETVPTGSIINLTATPTGGSTFAVWGGANNCSTSPTCSVTVTSNKTVNAGFSLPTYTFRSEGAEYFTSSNTYNGGAKGIVTCSSGLCQKPSVPKGTKIKITAYPDGGSALENWVVRGGTIDSGCTDTHTSGGTKDCTVIVNANTEVYAYFWKLPAPVRFPITVTKQGNGTGEIYFGQTTSNFCADTQTPDCRPASFTQNESVTLRARPTLSSTFAGWGGACSGTSNTCTLTVDQAKNVTATFTKGSTTPTPIILQISPTGTTRTTTFNVSTAGTYKLMGRVKAPDGGKNSFYINIDSPPTQTEAMTWDIDPTNSWHTAPVSWRGSGQGSADCQADNGFPRCAQFNPKTWNLTSGEHTLYIVEREVGTEIESIEVVSNSINQSANVFQVIWGWVKGWWE